jgi:UDP-N-acetyl-D-mannosaminuronic acid dehydrogenase
MSERTYDVCIIGGCGHVGLPLGMAFADRGKNVVLYDISEANIAKVNRAEVPFQEHGAAPVLERVVKSGKLTATSDTTVIARSEILIMVIGTPVDEHLNPKYHDVLKAVRDIKPHLGQGQLLVLRSTLYPGVSDKINEYLQDEGVNIDVAFCPERIAEGHALTELYELPQIISGCTPRAAERARGLFFTLTNTTVELTPIEAELAKLYTNTWRYINFAISNQFYTIANSRGLDFYKIYDAMTQDYPRLKAFAQPGLAAGPCLFKDTMQLSAFSGNNFFLGHSAMLVNEGLPAYIINQLKQSTDLSHKTIGILGMAFKANNDDPRESLSYKLKKIAELEAGTVLCTDVYIKSPEFVDVYEVLYKADIIIVATPHDEYKKLNLDGKQVVDIWNIYGKGALV